MWVLLSILGLLAEMTVIVVLGRRATAAFERLPLEAPASSDVSALAPPAEAVVPPDPVPS